MEGLAADAAAQRIYAPNLIANSSLLTVKFISACFTGAVAGILGLDNGSGFLLFLVATLITTFCIYSINCHGNPQKYIQGGMTELLNPGQDNIFAFILVWTLFYGAPPNASNNFDLTPSFHLRIAVVHVYD
ncbi:hypothetical protein APHAL10511_003137 [Amanita phalloides]|nr:hypothetical protein APHAL10511_003137 [Amanita phalloides]